MTGFEVLGSFILSAVWDALKAGGVAAKDAIEPPKPSETQLQVASGDQEWMDKVQEQVTKALPRLQGEVKDLVQYVERLREDLGTKTVLGNLGFEAAREALEERRYMLSCAVAGLLSPRYSVEDRARIERKLRELDASDVRHLFGLQLARRHMPKNPSENTGDLMWRNHREESERLVAAGCVYREASGFGGGTPSPPYGVTGVGFKVLDVLVDYVDDRGPLTRVEDLSEKST